MRHLLLVMILAGLSFYPVQAQQSPINLSVFPAINEFVIEAGESLESEISIENTSATPLPLAVSASSMLPFESVKSDDQHRFDASQWISFSSETLAIESDELIIVDYEIIVPEDAAPGGHYAQINVRPLQPTTTDELNDNYNAQVVPQLSALVLITVPGDIVEAAEINLIEPTDKLPANALKETEFVMTNTGNVHLLVSPTITITKNDQTIDNYTYPPQLILPGTERSYQRQWTGGSGQYEVRVSALYGSDNVPLEDQMQVSVTVPAWQLILAGSAGVLILLLILRVRHLPRVFDALRGRSVSIIGSYKSTARDQEQIDEEAEASYSEVIAELERQRSILGLPSAPKTKLTNAVETAIDSTADQIRHDELERRTTAKTDELKQQAKAIRATVSEEPHPDSNTKTVVIQTGASTIVREEPLHDTPGVTTPTKINVISDSVKVTHKKATTSKVKIKTTAKKTKSPRKTKSKSTKTQSKPKSTKSTGSKVKKTKKP